MAQYRLITDHYVSDRQLWAGSIVTEGIELPLGWKPTLACDPIDSEALLNLFDAGPPPGGPEGDCMYSSLKWNGNRWDGKAVAPPERYWKLEVRDGEWVWILNGAGEVGYWRVRDGEKVKGHLWRERENG